MTSPAPPKAAPAPAGAQQFPKRRGKHPSRDDYLTDEEIREVEQAKLQERKLAVNTSARRLSIMQEHKSLTDQANAITKVRETTG